MTNGMSPTYISNPCLSQQRYLTVVVVGGAWNDLSPFGLHLLPTVTCIRRVFYLAVPTHTNIYRALSCATRPGGILPFPIHLTPQSKTVTLLRIPHSGFSTCLGGDSLVGDVLHARLLNAGVHARLIFLTFPTCYHCRTTGLALAPAFCAL